MQNPMSNSFPGFSVTFYRDGIFESEHLVVAALVDNFGALLQSAGDPELITAFRSAAKPIQALPITMLSTKHSLDIREEELAICCASHPGTPEHAALAASALSISGFNPDDLICGPAGNPPACLKHGCSGNHSALLIGAKLLGVPLAGYHLPDHPIQLYILDLMKRMSGASDIIMGIDGCGVPTFGMRLREMATAFANLCGSDPTSNRITSAMGAHPHLVGSARGIDVGIMRASRGRIVAKTGAEGLLCLGLVGENRGIAVKGLDGTHAAVGAVTLRFLVDIGWMTQSEVEVEYLARWLKGTDERSAAVTGCEVFRDGAKCS